MAFGIYVHIPYCIQRCSYCDFATYEKSSILPPSEYIRNLNKEIQVYGPLLKHRFIDTLYFGGGTPSLIEPELLNSVIKTLKTTGFQLIENCEMTLEINPATIDNIKLNSYIEMGFNRFSVGAQSFNDELLERVGRKHTAEDTQETLAYLVEKKLNYTFDLLFALPQQTKVQLQKDLEIISELKPPHLSAYCLTVPDGHPLSKARLPEDEQIEMFEMIEACLAQMGLDRYEISNFALPGRESRHNSIYWSDEDYWGVGLSAHSYIKDDSWGTRFWNANNINTYIRDISNLDGQTPQNLVKLRKSSEFEALTEFQSFTDYCHTFLRTKKGLDLTRVEQKYGPARRGELEAILLSLKERGFILNTDESRWSLTPQGILLSNQVFGECTFLK